MGMWTTANQDQMDAELIRFSKVTEELFGSHSYAAGYYSSMIVDLLPLLPKAKQKEVIADMIRARARMERQLQEQQSVA